MLPPDSPINFYKPCPHSLVWLLVRWRSNLGGEGGVEVGGEGEMREGNEREERERRERERKGGDEREGRERGKGKGKMRGRGERREMRGRKDEVKIKLGGE